MSDRLLKSSLLIALVLMWPFVELHAGPSEKNLKQLTVNCIQCHASVRTGAPLMGDPSDWKPIMEKGIEQVIINVIQGFKGMPPRGYCSSCSEQDFIELVKLMAGVQEWKQ